MNLWLGSCSKNTSSGLHHDFHDNFYFLIQGKKEFTLFPPFLANSLYLHGNVRQIHSNGLIEYESSLACRSDGACLIDVAEYRVDKAEKALSNAVGLNAKEKADAELEQALDYLLQVKNDDGKLNVEFINQ